MLDTAGGKDGTVQPGNGRKVHRKDILGYWGRCHGVPHLHFEIFMTEADFTAWFEQAGHRVQLGEKNPVTPTSKDYWGHSYFVIPGGQAFVTAPPGQRGSAYFPTLTAGTLERNSTLYVEAYFHKGERYTRSWIDRGDGRTTLLTALPVKDHYAEYEYNLYQRAVDLYPACPSDGYELLRFGRLLGDHQTLPASACSTWVAVPFDENGTQGYIDINQDVIQKLSDADFPFFTGWQKIEDINTPLDPAGLWRYDELRKLVGDAPAASQYAANQSDPQFSLNDELTGYLRGSDAARARLRGFVCHAPSEWDPANNDRRYQGLNEPDGFFGSRADMDPDGYNKFQGFLRKFQFLDQTPLGGGQKFWFFHPLAFIRHFRKCGWLSASEFKQLLPTEVLREAGTRGLYYEDVAYSRNRSDLVTTQRVPLNNALRKYCIFTPVRMAAFFGNALQETQWLGKLHENNPNEWYYPWDGRGFLQLTHSSNYISYWDFRGRHNQISQAIRDALAHAQAQAKQHRAQAQTHIADPVSGVTPMMIVWREQVAAESEPITPEDAFAPSDSAGFYWAKMSMGRYADGPIILERRAVTATRPPVSQRPHTLNPPVGRIYYHSISFRDASAAVNLPAAVGRPNAPFNGYIARCVAYAQVLAVLAEIKFPDASGDSSMGFPEGRTPRRN